MKASLIPWQEFLATLKKQNPGSVEPWLRHWLFADEGVMEADPEFVTLHAKFPIADFRAAAKIARAESVL
jgi:hypothetical protein